jgi:uncharacterized protein (DUF433 family)
VKTPGIVGGRPRIKDTRISVDFLARFIISGTQPEEIAEMYPHLTLGGIYDAISYYYDHQAEIDQIIAEGEALWKRIVAATDEHGRIDIGLLGFISTRTSTRTLR